MSLKDGMEGFAGIERTLGQGMNHKVSSAMHLIEVESEPGDDRQVVRCSCGWEQSTGGWMLESSEDEVRRLIAAHLANVDRPGVSGVPEAPRPGQVR